jgi:DNA-binding CsgD family transcriptional regulator
MQGENGAIEDTGAMKRLPFTSHPLSEKIYGGVLETPPWGSLLRALETFIGTQSAALVLRRPDADDPGTIISFHENTDAIRQFQQRWHEDSPFAILPEETVFVLRDLVTPSELEQLEHYQHFLKVYGVIDIMGFDIYNRASRIRVRVRVVRMEGESLFTRKDKSNLESIVPLMAQAVTIFASMESQRVNQDIYQELLGSLHIVCFFLNSSMEVVGKNSLANQILDRKDGFLIRHQRLRCVDAEDQKLLTSTMEEFFKSPRYSTGKSQATALLFNRREAGLKWSAVVRPAFRPGELMDEEGPRIVLLLRDPDYRLIPTPDILKEAFHLSTAEAKLALELIHGLSLTAAARSLAISRNTARTQLSSIFQKTNVHSQVQFVKFVSDKLSNQWFV